MARTPANRRGQAGGVKRQALLTAMFEPAVQVVESESEEQGPEAEERAESSEPKGADTNEHRRNQNHEELRSCRRHERRKLDQV